MKKILALAALAAIVFVADLRIVSTADAQTFRNGNWRGRAVFVGNSFDRCEISVGFVDGRRLYIAQFGSNSVAIGIGKSDWSMQPNARGSMEFEFYDEDRGGKRTKKFSRSVNGRALSSRPNQFWFPIGRNVPLINALQTSDILYIDDRTGIVGGSPRRYGHRLNDVRSAMLKLSICTVLYSTR